VQVVCHRYCGAVGPQRAALWPKDHLPGCGRRWCPAGSHKASHAGTAHSPTAPLHANKVCNCDCNGDHLPLQILASYIYIDGGIFAAALLAAHLGHCRIGGHDRLWDMHSVTGPPCLVVKAVAMGKRRPCLVTYCSAHCCPVFAMLHPSLPYPALPLPALPCPALPCPSQSRPSFPWPYQVPALPCRV